jgi:hypothetical protein
MEMRKSEIKKTASEMAFCAVMIVLKFLRKNERVNQVAENKEGQDEKADIECGFRNHVCVLCDMILSAFTKSKANPNPNAMNPKLIKSIGLLKMPIT